MIRRASCLLTRRAGGGGRVWAPSQVSVSFLRIRFSSTGADVGSGAAVVVPGDGIGHTKSRANEFGAILGVATVVAAGVASTASCEQKGKSMASSPKEESVKSISLWPDGIDEAQIDALVEEVLKDPSLNSPMIPDIIERQLYKSTIQLTMNMAYGLISGIDGMELLAHKVHVTTKGVQGVSSEKSTLRSAPDQSGYKINEKILEEVAGRLLENKSVNLNLVPDALEKQVYVNCLKVFFRIVTLISESICITLCGHQLRLRLEPMDTHKALEKAMSRSSSLSKVDMDHMYEFARKMGVNDQELANTRWWDRLFIRRELLAHLHASLYGLMLGIADDIMANTRIWIMSDELGFEIQPDENYDPDTKKRRNNNSEEHAKEIHERDTRIKELEAKHVESRSEISVGSFGTATFLAGVGVGVAVASMMITGTK